MQYVKADIGFLGPEFLTWLYFYIDTIGGEWKSGKQEVRVGVGKRISLRTLQSGDSKIVVSGSRLDDSGEVLQAVRSGAYIDSMVIDIVIEERTYTVTLNALDGALTQVKLQQNFNNAKDGHEFLPEEGNLEEEDLDVETTLVLRLSCMDEIEALVDGFFQVFLEKRLAQAFVSQEIAAIRQTVAENLAQKVPALSHRITSSAATYPS